MVPDTFSFDDIVDEPSKLTKVKLRAALAAVDAPLPPVAALKSVYVQYYSEHVIPLKKTKKTKSKSKPAVVAESEEVASLSPASKGNLAKKIGIIQVGFENGIPISSKKQATKKVTKVKETVKEASFQPKPKKTPTSRFIAGSNQNIQELKSNHSYETPKHSDQMSQSFMFAAFALFLVCFFTFIVHYHSHLSGDLKMHIDELKGNILKIGNDLHAKVMESEISNTILSKLR
eukprot:Nk52_evm49s221 gene=Nk52_evmTU49s221